MHAGDGFGARITNRCLQARLDVVRRAIHQTAYSPGRQSSYKQADAGISDQSGVWPANAPKRIYGSVREAMAASAIKRQENDIKASIFSGVIPALMTPCTGDRMPDFDALVRKAKKLVEVGMSAVVYCGSMGDWPLLTDGQRMEGVERLVKAGVPVIVGTGAVNTASAVAHAAHASKVGARGLMVIPRVLSRGSVPAAQKNHFKAILAAAPELPAVIYNSPYYGFATRVDLFFALRAEHANLVGFKEFGGVDDPTLRCRAYH